MRCSRCGWRPDDTEAVRCARPDCGGRMEPEVELSVARGVRMVAGRDELVRVRLTTLGHCTLHDVSLRLSSRLLEGEALHRVGTVATFGTKDDVAVEIEASRPGHGKLSVLMTARETPGGDLLAFAGSCEIEVEAPETGATSIVVGENAEFTNVGNIGTRTSERRDQGWTRVDLRLDVDATRDARGADRAACPYCLGVVLRTFRACANCGQDVPAYVWAKRRCSVATPAALAPIQETALDCNISGRRLRILSRPDIRFGRNRSNELVTRVEPVDSYKDLNRSIHRFYGDLRVREERVFLRAHRTPFTVGDDEVVEWTADGAVELGLAKVLTLQVEPFRLNGADSPLLAVGLQLRQPADTGNHMHPCVIDVLRWVEIGADHAQRPIPVAPGHGLFRIVRFHGQYWVETVEGRPVHVGGRLLPAGYIAHLEPGTTIAAGPCLLTSSDPASQSRSVRSGAW